MANNISILVEAKDNASQVLNQVGSEVQNLGNTTDAAAPKASRFESALGVLGSRLRFVAETFLIYKVGQAVSDFATSSVTAAGQLEQTNMAFQSLTGNVAEANKVFGQLVQYANITPFQSKDIVEAAQTLMGFGTAGQQTVDVLKQLGDVVSVGGGNLQQLSLVTGQIFAQGKMRAQDMYQVINDGGAGLIKIMAQNVGGMKNLTAEFDAGGVSSDQYFKAMQQATTQGGFAFHGAQKEADTLNGSLSTLKDSATQFGEALIGVHTDPKLGLQIQPGGLFDRMRSGIKDVSDALQGWQPAVQRAVPTFLSDLGRLASTVTNALGPSFEALFHTLADRLGPSLERLMPFLKFSAEVLGGIVVAAIWVLVNVLNVLISVLSFVAQVVENVANWFVHAWGLVTSAWGGAVSFFRGIASSIGGVFSSVASAISAPFRSAFNFVADAWNNTVGRLHFTIPGWVPELGGKSFGVPDIPHFALGTLFAPGGVSLVGERGPELVQLPRGAQVTPAAQTQQRMGGSRLVNIDKFIVNNNVDADAVIRKIGFKLATA